MGLHRLLLDTLHEDLNLVREKPYVEWPESEVGKSIPSKRISVRPPVSTNQKPPFRFRFALERSQPHVH